MRISKVRVQGYRSIADLDIGFDDLTALVGSGGVGKSAFLRAVKWFFEGGDLDVEDLHLFRDASGGVVAAEVIVTVTFAGLNDLDRNILGLTPPAIPLPSLVAGAPTTGTSCPAPLSSSPPLTRSETKS